MASIRKRGNRWQAQVRRLGYPLQTSSFILQSDAEAWGRQREVDLDKGEVVQVRSELKSTTLCDLLIRYDAERTSKKRGASSETARISAMKRHAIATTTLLRLTPTVIASYRDERLASVSTGSVRREMTILRHCLEVAIKEWGVPLVVNPFTKVNKPVDSKPRSRRLKDSELAAISHQLSQCQNPLARQVFLFALASGMRRGEVLLLTWQNVDWTLNTALLPLTKNGESRIVPLGPQSVAVLRERREHLIACSNIVGPVHLVGPVLPISANAVRLGWERAKAKVGIADFRFHDLRHEAISRFFERGLSVPEVSLISGHKDTRMLFRYTHLKAEDVARKLAQL